MVLDRDWDLKSLLEQALEEAQREEGYKHNKTISEQERLLQQREILRKENRIRKEERKYRERRIVGKVKDAFWDREV